MPWESSGDYIRSGHRSASSDCRTITLSKPQGIKAIYCNYGSSWGIASYLFEKAKGWTLSKAKKWFSNYHEKLHESVNTRTFHYDFTRIYNTFVKQFGQVDGEIKFKYFINSNDLDTSKQYHPLVQFHESFQWVKPLVRFLRQDKEAKYYGITCITANISMNNKNYTPEMLESGAVSMNYRPINLNHDHGKWLPFPRTRIEWAKFEDNSLEGVCRVDNRDKWLQDKLDNHEILHPSIEGRQIPPDLGGGFHFTALALLEKGKMIPGDPLTGIQPLMLNEHLYESIGKLVRGEDCLTCYGDDSIISEGTIKSPTEDVGGEKLTEEKCKKDKKMKESEELTENHIIEKTVSDNGRDKMSSETEKSEKKEVKEEESETVETRKENLKLIELETTNKLLQTEIEDLSKKYKTLKAESQEKITDLEFKLAKANEKSTVMEGLKGKVGDTETKLLETQKTVEARDKTIEDQKITNETLEMLVTKKDKLIENLRVDIKENEQTIKEHKSKTATAVIEMKKMQLDKEAAEKRALEAENEKNQYIEKYSDQYSMNNKIVQENTRLNKKMHALQEENTALRTQTTKDGVTIERLERDAKISRKRAEKATKERKEALAKIGIVEANEDGTVDLGDVKLKI
jgi:hypothetical protein